jgi:hypothetical protein
MVPQLGCSPSLFFSLHTILNQGSRHYDSSAKTPIQKSNKALSVNIKVLHKNKSEKHFGLWVHVLCCASTTSALFPQIFITVIIKWCCFTAEAERKPATIVVEDSNVQQLQH